MILFQKLRVAEHQGTSKPLSPTANSPCCVQSRKPPAGRRFQRGPCEGRSLQHNTGCHQAYSNATQHDCTGVHTRKHPHLSTHTYMLHPHTPQTIKFVLFCMRGREELQKSQSQTTSQKIKILSNLGPSWENKGWRNNEATPKFQDWDTLWMRWGLPQARGEQADPCGLQSTEQGSSPSASRPGKCWVAGVGPEGGALWGVGSLALFAKANVTVKNAKAKTVSFKGQVTFFQYLPNAVLLQRSFLSQEFQGKNVKTFQRTRYFDHKSRHLRRRPPCGSEGSSMREA